MNKLIAKIEQIEDLADDLNDLLTPYELYLDKLQINLRDASLSERIQIAKLIASIQDNAPPPEEPVRKPSRAKRTVLNGRPNNTNDFGDRVHTVTDMNG